MKASFNKWDGKNWHVRVDHGLGGRIPRPGDKIQVSKKNGGFSEVELGSKVTTFNARTSIFRIVPKGTPPATFINNRELQRRYRSHCE